MARQINNYPRYFIYSDGRVYSNKSKKFLKPGLCSRGYEFVNLWNIDKKPKMHMNHRLVACHYIPNIDNKPTVNHKDSNKRNNNINNLEWATHSENILHSFKNTKRKQARVWKGKFGKAHNRSKPFNVFNLKGEIIGRYESGLHFQRETGIRHTVARYGIKTGKPNHELLFQSLV